jgi:hypothetical protein
MRNVTILNYNDIALFGFGCATEMFALPALNLRVGIIPRLLPLRLCHIAVLAELVSKSNRSIV